MTDYDNLLKSDRKNYGEGLVNEYRDKMFDGKAIPTASYLSNLRDKEDLTTDEIKQKLKDDLKAKAELNYLLSLDDVVDAVHSLGLFFMDNEIKILSILLCGRLVVNCDATSKNATLMGESGAGKDYLGKTISQILFPYSWLTFDYTSNTYESYMLGSREDEDIAMTHPSLKILYRKDVTLEQLNSPRLRNTFSEHNRKEGITGDRNADNKTMENHYRKPFQLMTIGSDVNISYHTKRRINFSIPINYTDDQLKKLIDSIFYLNPHNIKEIGFKNLNNKCKLVAKESMKLRPVKVNIPDDVAKKLHDFFQEIMDVVFFDDESNKYVLATYANNLLDLAKFSAAFHQKGRKPIASNKEIKYPSGEKVTYDVIEANDDDADRAIRMFKQFSNFKEIEGMKGLNDRQRRIAEYVKTKCPQPIEVAYLADSDSLPTGSWPTTKEDCRKIASYVEHFEFGRFKKNGKKGNFAIKYTNKDDIDDEIF